MKISVEYAVRPVKENRVSANAARVPISVATIVATMPTLSVLPNACRTSSLSASSWYHFSEKPVKCVPLRP